MTDLAHALASTFRGRADYVALGTEYGGFEPHHCPDGIDPAWLDERHLAGVQALGFYVLTTDSTCFCTCVDFDNKPSRPDPEWRAKAEAVYFELVGLGLCPLVEISQSGQSAHVWLFLDGPTEAWIPRAFWRGLAAEKLGTSFREIYPRQDRLAGKGLGNLVRFPLWNQSRFVDVENEWRTIDPLEALSSIQRVSGSDLQYIAWQAGMGQLRPGPAPASGSPDGGLSPRVKALVERSWTLLGRRWLNDARGMSDTSPSAVAMSLATLLVKSYVPTPEIEAAVREWCRVYAPDKAVRDSWVTATVAKAYDFAVERSESKSVQVSTFETACYEFLDQLAKGGTRYYASGIPAFDASVDGVASGEVAVVAARPGHGKSAFAFQWVDHVASTGVPCLVVSEEMCSCEIGKRRVQSISRLPFDLWGPETVGQLKGDVIQHFRDRAPVYIVENCNSVDRLDEVVDQHCQLHGVGLVAVDYLQLLTAHKENPYQNVTEISRRLKQAARRNNCAVLALCQLNREIESREDFKPKNSDLRESGQIEQDADLIIFLIWLHRVNSEKYAEYEYQMWITKRRNGPIRQPKIQTVFDAGRQLIGGKP
jgi:replicative DNA helicase